MKNKARVSKKKDLKRQKYLIDTSIVAQKRLCKTIKKRKLCGLLLVPNAVIAELENLANKGSEVGFFGLEEIAKLHKLKKIKVKFIGPRPNEHQIKFAKSGEIDALIINLAFKEKAILITADRVQAKSAEAYGIKVIFLKTKIKKEKKVFLFKIKKLF